MQKASVCVVDRLYLLSLSPSSQYGVICHLNVISIYAKTLTNMCIRLMRACICTGSLMPASEYTLPIRCINTTYTHTNTNKTNFEPPNTIECVWGSMCTQLLYAIFCLFARCPFGTQCRTVKTIYIAIWLGKFPFPFIFLVYDCRFRRCAITNIANNNTNIRNDDMESAFFLYFVFHSKC